jgi:hypothetical protein
VADGEIAVVGWNNDASYGLLLVQRGGCRAHATGPSLDPLALGNQTKTRLTYFVVECCWQLTQRGYGEIRPTDLTGGGTSVSSLRTDTSAAANPRFYRLVGAGGAIAVDWEADPGYTEHRTATWMVRRGQFTFRWYGTSSSARARARARLGAVTPRADGRLMKESNGGNGAMGCLYGVIGWRARALGVAAVWSRVESAPSLARGTDPNPHRQAGDAACESG